MKVVYSGHIVYSVQARNANNMPFVNSDFIPRTLQLVSTIRDFNYLTLCHVHKMQQIDKNSQNEIFI